MTRFDDDGVRLENFGDELLAECPSCGKLLRIVPDPTKKPKVPALLTPRRATCVACGYNKESDGKTVGMGEPFDWYFGLPLWLQTNCNGEVVWAVNERHLEWLKQYVAATNRVEKTKDNGSLVSRMPHWIKATTNRDDVLRSIERMYKKLN